MAARMWRVFGNSAIFLYRHVFTFSRHIPSILILKVKSCPLTLSIVVKIEDRDPFVGNDYRERPRHFCYFHFGLQVISWLYLYMACL